MRGGAYNTIQRKEALEKADGLLVRPKKGVSTVCLYVREIETKPELFQPREFSYGFRDTDKDHVAKLKRAIEINGELDPIVVIKLGNEWVCIDGHHRLAAYQKAKWQEKITCEWFNGDIRAAMDESMERNKKLRLNVPQADRLEEAWKRALLGGWSIREIAELCGVSRRTVSNMRNVKAAAEESDKFGRDFRKRLGGPLTETSWSQARLIYNGIEPKEATEEEQAAKLAKRINARLTDRLSRDPRVTAKALAIYDPDLPGELMKLWKAKPIQEAIARQRAEDTENPYESQADYDDADLPEL